MTDEIDRIRTDLGPTGDHTIYEGDLPLYSDAHILLAEIDRLRRALTAMHRRAQRAEGIADRCAADRPQGAQSRSVGRALANYAAARERVRAEEWRRVAEDSEAARIRLAEELREAQAVGAAMREGIAQARRAAIGDAERIAIAHARVWEKRHDEWERSDANDATRRAMMGRTDEVARECLAIARELRALLEPATPPADMPRT